MTYLALSKGIIYLLFLSSGRSNAIICLSISYIFYITD